MQQYKIDNHLKESGTNIFPEYYSLNTEECKCIVDEIATYVLGSTRFDNIFVGIQEVCKSTSYSEDAIMDIQPILNQHSFQCNGSIYIIWDNDEIDRMERDLFIQHWQDIWYPPSDEAVILYCADSKKVLMVSDFGEVHSK